jgi:HK97 family phage prohead protease
MTNEIERRYTIGRVELRAGGEKPTIGGYAAKFEKPSQNLGGFIEVVRSTFFNKSRGDNWPDVQARYNHDDMWLLGTTAAGTLRLKLDEVGLDYEVDINPADPQAMTVHARTARGDVGRSSFAFHAFEDEWGTSDQGFPMRSLISGQLVDVAPVNSPAYLDTSAGLRSLAAKFSADIAEVRKLAETNELTKFFTVTGQPAKPKKLSAEAALALAKSITP